LRPHVATRAIAIVALFFFQFLRPDGFLISRPYSLRKSTGDVGNTRPERLLPYYLATARSSADRIEGTCQNLDSGRSSGRVGIGLMAIEHCPLSRRSTCVRRGDCPAFNDGDGPWYREALDHNSVPSRVVRPDEAGAEVGEIAKTTSPTRGFVANGVSRRRYSDWVLSSHPDKRGPRRTITTQNPLLNLRPVGTRAVFHSSRMLS